MAIEPEPYLRGRAEQAAATAPVPVRVSGGVAASLEHDDETFDGALASLVL